MISWSGAPGVLLVNEVQPLMQRCARPVSGRLRSFVYDSYLCTGAVTCDPQYS